MAQLVEFIGNHLILSLAFMSVFFFLIMMLMNEKMQKFANVNAAELTQLVNHKNAVVIDTRNADAFKQGHIVNALNIPLADFSSQNAKIDTLKGKTVIAYCINGMTSKSACKQLTNAGIDHVFNLTGGINGWINDKLPVVK